MANEITVTNTLVISKGELSERKSKSVRITMSGDDISHVTQSFTGTGTALAVATGVTTQGVAFLNNCSSSGDIDIGTVTGSTFTGVIRLKATECGCVRLSPSTALFGKPVSGTVVLEHLIVED